MNFINYDAEYAKKKPPLTIGATINRGTTLIRLKKDILDAL